MCFMPLCLTGASSMRDPLQVLPMQIGMDLIHSVCAVSHAKSPDQVGVVCTRSRKWAKQHFALVTVGVD